MNPTGSNSTVASTPAKLPEVETFARSAAGVVTIQVPIPGSTRGICVIFW